MYESETQLQSSATIYTLTSPAAKEKVFYNTNIVHAIPIFPKYISSVNFSGHPSTLTLLVCEIKRIKIIFIENTTVNNI